MAYEKPWMSYSEQLTQLIERGMIVTDRAKALDYLERIGYYRLSGYWYAFRVRESTTKILDQFKTGATFQNAVDLYVFDKRLRMLAMDALERIEIALRVDISYNLGKLDPFAYQNVSLFRNKFATHQDSKGLTNHQKWINKHKQLIERSKEEFVEHNQRKYGLPLAIWVACEIWDFGTTSTLFSGIRKKEQDCIASQYSVTDGIVFATWLRSLTYLRNVCAHHSRLWNRNIVDQPKLPSDTQLQWVPCFHNNSQAQSRCFLLLMITKHLLDIVNPNSSWAVRMKTHLESFPDLSHLGLDLARMGAPHNWGKYW